ncbi:acetyl-coenzyme A carboxylase carboxyl transferase subunit alpha [Ligilactobacillus acidipiscis DSM 15836]|uniref:acetyl-CoA carboxytransferase n=1 Tax=Ligilactobacillus acidipiscis DSM 15836 TaxID=1423716 RepID=A0ABR5PKM2_9LACO|nr:carboxyltransferase subunit alpha [Ligilactobacillus acidipiscis]KRM29123.1 acetyl-coenzyme A carboxylase carboxyl transferase subunit alpha [Ligilactobacillus acidipiscis DSM 15836]GEN20953.1 acetyl-CoA carboxylase carboxyl transferase subunit alpha [Ligilactobacillus acidipiscis]
MFSKKQRTAGEIVAAARDGQKVTGQELLAEIFPDFMEMHGDRLNDDDPSIVGGLAHFTGRAVTVLVIDKGTSAKDRIAKHFGSPAPAAYRKSLRLIKQAEKFERPVLAFINTAGAYPAASAEEQGQGEAIARNLLGIAGVKVPLLTVIYGEGGSGGALALACGDEVWMSENSMYSVLSPEGFASILWKDASKSDEAAEVMQLTPEALLKANIIEGIIPEPNAHKRFCKNIIQILRPELEKLEKLSPDELVAQRKARFRKF